MEDNGMKQRLWNAKYKIWYAMCFLLLGIIDQRRGSAVGEIQMLFSNMTGIVMALLLFPSLDCQKLRQKIYAVWTIPCIILTIAACIVGKIYWSYTGQWVTAVLSIAVWSYLVIYIVQERKVWKNREGIRQPYFWGVMILFLLMVLSAHEKTSTLWCLLIFGGFFIIGVPQSRQSDFFSGMLNGIIVWFFIQQILAFGFRPYDYVRYRGLYSGETQNGIFYMIVYCAFLAKWLWSKEKKQSRLLSVFYFLMAAGCVGFLFFTASRSGLLGAVVVTLVLITGYDIGRRKSFYGWLLHGAAMVLCVAIMIPTVYGCIRYLPTVLHHPVWYEGEYVEGESVCSYDSWDSSKYISFEEAMEDSLGRIFHAFGIDYHALFEKYQSRLGVMKVHAEEISETAENESDVEEPGSSPINYFMLDDVDTSDAMWAREVIYVYYWRHLNIIGHPREGQGFYTIWDRHYTHAHNVFLQIAYDYGIPAGILFIGIYLYSIFLALRMRKPEGWACAAFLLGIICFGLLEMTLTPGQITVPLMWIMFYFAGKESRALPKSANQSL